VLRKRLSPQVQLLRSTDIARLWDPAPNEELVKADLGDPSSAADLVKDIDAIVHFGGLSKEADFASMSTSSVTRVCTKRHG
jgi:uronate dehydrogenase